MAPNPPNPQPTLDDPLRTTVQSLFSIQSCIHGYQGPATQRALLQNITTYHSSLQQVHASAPALANRSIPPDIIQYIDDARNPDVYTREFVELTQKGNRYARSKAVAFGKMRDQLAKAIVDEWPEMAGVVERVMDGQGGGLDGLEGMIGGGNLGKEDRSDGGGGDGGNADDGKEVIERKDGEMASSGSVLSGMETESTRTVPNTQIEDGSQEQKA